MRFTSAHQTELEPHSLALPHPAHDRRYRKGRLLAWDRDAHDEGRTEVHRLRRFHVHPTDRHVPAAPCDELVRPLCSELDRAIERSARMTTVLDHLGDDSISAK